MEAKIRQLVLNILKHKKITKKTIESEKKKWAKKYKVKLPLNSEILSSAKPAERKKLKALTTKPTRTLSGVSVVAIMTEPAACPGKCIYCPQGTNAPKSYTGYEPAAMRARLNRFDPYSQVKNRLKQLKLVGHDTSKNELIIMGGTFPSLSETYQKQFVKRAFDAFNNKTSKTLNEAQKTNETSQNRVIGLTIETRPDFYNIPLFLDLGCTRVELGVQNIDDAILKAVCRGHLTNTTIKTTRDLKDAGFKVLYHIMPGLPGSDFNKDVRMFKELFTNPDFMPDMLKIYPTLVIKGTELYKLWKSKKYAAIDEKYMEKLLIEIYKICPPWVRIMRVQRDIPSQFIEAGPIQSNLREIVDKKFDKANKWTNEIRFREVGHYEKRTGAKPGKPELKIRKYDASGGKEYFLSYEDSKGVLFGYLRLRISKRKEALVRELHVVGEVVPIGKKGKETQHSGLGEKLLEKAEGLAKKEGKTEILVISGVGVRNYYRKKGYKLKEKYMHKKSNKTQR